MIILILLHRYSVNDLLKDILNAIYDFLRELFDLYVLHTIYIYHLIIINIAAKQISKLFQIYMWHYTVCLEVRRKI